MSRNMESIFPDVFSYPDSKHEMQLSSIYEKSGQQGKTHGKYPNTNLNIQLQPQTNSQHYPHAFGHTSATVHMKCPSQMKSSGVEQSDSDNLPVTGATLREGNTREANTREGNTREGNMREGNSREGNTREYNVNTNNNGVVLPPMKRVVKCAISSTHSTFIISTLAVVHTLICLVTPVDTSPLMATIWGSFLHIWLIVTILQMISHSVYLCTPITMIGSFVHLSIVMVSAISIPALLFAEHLWLAPCLCIVIVTHQSLLLCLVYTQEKKIWIYALVGCVAVIIPMIQLVQIDSSNEDMVVASFMWSAMSIFILYVFAFANSKGAVLVDVTVGASPTWQLQE